MRKNSEKASLLEKIAAFIVDRRKGFYLVYILLVIFSIFSANWVQVNNNITDYLSEDTETRKGITLMEKEFITYATADVMVDNISFSDAEALCKELEGIKGVKEIVFDDTDKHFSDASALFSVTFSGDKYAEETISAYSELENKLRDYDT